MKEETKEETKDVTIYVFARKWNNCEWEMDCSTHILESCGYYTILQLYKVVKHISMPVLDIKTLTLAEIEHLRDEITKERAESQLRLNAIEEKIQSLLAIEVQ